MESFSPQHLVDRVWRAALNGSFSGSPTPEDPPFAHATGPDPDRLLLLGSGPAVGWGVSSHQLGLPGRVARDLAALTARGVEVDLIAGKSMTALSAIKAIEGRRLSQYDAIVITLGMTDSVRFLSRRAFRKRCSALLSTLSERTTDVTALVLVGMPPLRSVPEFDNWFGALADRRARCLNDVMWELAEEFPRTSYVQLQAPPPPPGGTLSSVHSYGAWARLIAAHLASLMHAGGIAGRAMRRAPGSDLEARHDAVSGLRLMDTPPEPRFDRIAELARSMFDAGAATITLVDGQRLWMKSAAGIERFELPLNRSLVRYTIEATDATIIPSGRNDGRMRHNAAAARFGFVFYAGYPLRAPDGEVVGALSILDSKRRSWDNVDTDLLRDLALEAQRELWATASVSATETRVERRADRDGSPRSRPLARLGLRLGRPS